MTVFGHSGGGGGFLAGKQVFPVNYEAEVSRRLLEASHSNDLAAALECLQDSFVDVNFVGDVCLKVRKAEVVLREESPNEVRVGYEEFKTDVTALFLAVHNGNVALVRKLLSIGADVNQKLFRGYATTVAVRENHLEILEMLLKAGASQQACEEALLEASCYGHARIAELLMGSDLIRPRIAVHALFTACCRGFANVVDALLKCGVDVNAISRVLLQSCKPSLHTNVDCTALVAAIVSRQVSVVRLLLEAGAKTDVKVRLGAWSWDAASGEEFRVGAGLADPYDITWCAVEYFEESGSILRSLLEDMPPNMSHCGRTLLHHAILCGNAGAVKVLLECGAHVESPVKTTRKTDFCPLHMAVRLGFSTVLKCLIDFGCDIDSKTEASETGLMICARYKQEECLKILLRHGADLGLVNTAGQSASSIAGSNRWQLGFQEAVLSIIRDGKVPKSSNMSIFSPLLFVAQSGDVLALKALIEQGINLDNQDESGFSAVMVAAREGHVDTFRLLVFSGANVRLCNKSGDTALTLCALNHKRDLFEKVLLEFAIEQGNRYAGGFYALHCAARRGDLDAVKVLLSRGYDVNVSDVDGNTPLILAAREGHSQACEVLISHGACCDAKNAKGETALSLARTKHKNEAEQVILDELARKLVLTGSHLQKHTKGGKGAVHIKEVRMVEGGILCWGKSSRRNVICQAAEVGPSISFRKTRQRKGDTEEAGLFRVITTKNKEVHFVCEGGFEMAELWVRGLKLVTREAVSGRGNIM
nr:ankyrin-3 isoform X1 [Ipomoea batatas]